MVNLNAALIILLIIFLIAAIGSYFEVKHVYGKVTVRLYFCYFLSWLGFMFR